REKFWNFSQEMISLVFGIFGFCGSFMGFVLLGFIGLIKWVELGIFFCQGRNEFCCKNNFMVLFCWVL
ncbi:MAG: hypothetical protein O4965_01805, partial [Trichodesmium sp. St19_bin1]|nr:hypothetical protein [Trichodesmium sp. St19_bin1]